MKKWASLSDRTVPANVTDVAFRMIPIETQEINKTPHLLGLGMAKNLQAPLLLDYVGRRIGWLLLQR